MYVYDQFQGCRYKNDQVMVVLCFGIKKFEISKKIYSKGYFKFGNIAAAVFIRTMVL